VVRRTHREGGRSPPEVARSRPEEGRREVPSHRPGERRPEVPIRPEERLLEALQVGHLAGRRLADPIRPGERRRVGHREEDHRLGVPNRREERLLEEVPIRPEGHRPEEGRTRREAARGRVPGRDDS
jgi:hypothetical protein